MATRLLALLCVFSVPLVGSAQPLAQPRLDARGLPLPDGAIARIGDPRFVPPNDFYVNTVAWSPDGKYLASGGLRISIWDVKYAKIVREMPGTYQPYITALAWSKKGHFLAAMDNDSKFVIWDPHTGKSPWPDFRHPAEKNRGVVAMQFVGDDRFLALVTSTKLNLRPRDVDDPDTDFTAGWRVELWDVEKAALAKTWSEDEDKLAKLKALGEGYEFRHVALSPSGERMAWLASSPAKATEPNSVVFVYETATAKLLHTVKKLPRTYRADLPDEGETLVLYPFHPEKGAEPVARQGTVVTIPEGKTRYRFDYRFIPPPYLGPWTTELRGKTPIARSAVRFRDSLVTTDEVGLTRWDWATGKKQDEFNRPIGSFSLTRDGKRLAVAAGLAGERFQISEGELAPLQNEESFIRRPAVQFLADGRLQILVDDYRRQGEGARRQWLRDPFKNTVVERTYFHPWPEAVTRSDRSDVAGKILVYQQGTEIAVHDLAANKPLCKLEGIGPTYHFVLSADGKRVLAYRSDGTRLLDIRWFDSHSGREQGRYEARNTFSAAWYSSDGSVFGFSDRPGCLTLVDCERRKVLTTLDISQEKTSLHFFENQYLILSPTQYSTVEPRPGGPPAVCTFWNQQGQMVRRFSVPSEHKRMSMSGDGRLQPLMLPREIVVYETITGRPRLRLPLTREVADKVRWAFLSRDGKLLATTQDDTTVLIWDVDRLRTNKPNLPPPRTAKEAAPLWELLGDPDPVKAEPALVALVGAPETTLTVLNERLKPAATGDDNVFDKPNAIPTCLREIRALEVLERIGSAEAKKRVERIAAGHADALLTREAKLVLLRWR